MTLFASRSRQRGVTLLEALVAFFVFAAGSVAVVALERDLHLAADVARDRSQALRIGEDDVEQLRAFTAIAGDAGARTYAAIGSANAVVEAASAGERTTYRIERNVDDGAFAGTKATTVAVRWSDRRGGENAVVLHGFVAALDPQFSGSLALDGGTIRSAPRGLRGRSPGVAAHREAPRRRPQRLEADGERHDGVADRRSDGRRRRHLRRHCSDDEEFRSRRRRSRRLCSRTAAVRQRNGPRLVDCACRRHFDLAHGARRAHRTAGRHLSGARGVRRRGEEDRPIRRRRWRSCRRPRARRDRGIARRCRVARDRRPLSRLALPRRAAQRRPLVGAYCGRRERLDDRRRRRRRPRLPLSRRTTNGRRSMRTSRLRRSTPMSAARRSAVTSSSSAAATRVPPEPRNWRLEEARRRER